MHIPVSGSRGTLRLDSCDNGEDKERETVRKHLRLQRDLRTDQSASLVSNGLMEDRPPDTVCSSQRLLF